MIEKKIIQWAYAEHFDDVGFTPLSEIDYSDKQNFLQWINLGFNGNMNWFNNTIEERTDIKKYFPKGKSAVVFLHSYFHEDELLKNDKYKISLYAHGKDYHKLLRKKISRIAKKIREEYRNLDYKICVDSSPILEKYWAKKAGLGWIGKNCMLISPKFGSYTFIGLLLTNLELKSEKKEIKNFCGKCEKCIKACPTQAIIKNKTIDCKKCISYLTIEHKEKIDDNLKEKISPWLFGCDVCQEVCPWNKKLKETAEKKFHSVYNSDKIKNLINEYSETKFNDCFAGTPVKRAGEKHFKYIFELLSKS